MSGKCYPVKVDPLCIAQLVNMRTDNVLSILVDGDYMVPNDMVNKVKYQVNGINEIVLSLCKAVKESQGDLDGD